MIITKEEDEKVATAEAEYERDSAPPPYTPSTSSLDDQNFIETTPEDFGGSGVPPPRVRRTNFVKIIAEDNTIRGQYFIDPRLERPPQVYEQDEGASGSSEANLSLESLHGSVGAEVWILPEKNVSGDSGNTGELVVASIFAKSNNGSIRIRMCADCKRQPFKLKGITRNGSIHAMIPLSFVGPVTIRVSGGSEISRLVTERMTIFSDDGRVRHGFIHKSVEDVGHSDYVHGQTDWKGCSLDIGSKNGGVRLTFTDQPPEGGCGEDED